MHDSVLQYVASQVAQRGLMRKSVLEIGALNVNGSARQFFYGPYWGLDLTPGPGVDIVGDIHDGGLALPTADTVLCLEMLEHDTAPWVTVPRIATQLNTRGVAVITARGYVGRHAFPEHMTPHDYWRFSVEGMRHLLEWAELDVLDCRPDPQHPGVFATATLK